MDSNSAEAKPHSVDARDVSHERNAVELSHVLSKAEGQAVDQGADTELHRSLGTRHLTMNALGSAIGIGMWLGSSESLINGGPASLFIGFLMSSSIVWSVCQSCGEMAVIYPLPSGWGYWFSYWITIANELQAVVTILSYWTDQVPKAVWISVFWVVIISINIWAVRFFAEVEVFSSIVTTGGSPSEGPIGFRYWNAQPFNNGFKGFISVLATCVFAMAGSENAALVAAEIANPRRSVPKAIGSIWLCLGLFYILGSLMITLTVDPNDPGLAWWLWQQCFAFCDCFQNAGIPVMAHLTNAVIFISVISTGSISGYGGSRMLMGLAHVNMNHRIFGKADKRGRPWADYLATIGIGGALAYLNVSHTGAEVFTWLSNLFYLSIWPLNEMPSAKTFFANYISAIAVVIIRIGAHVWYRCPLWVDAGMIDLDQCRRFYADTLDEESAGVRKALVRRLRGLRGNRV
ncbi:hypothetical protein BO71DRAFT_456467 [Aspergillus ellipticus CBS 707.79]|uniref:Amino acid permease/ SLC12A domain-containing protein n=1 Tax=Aspergillus ellipticus CBS 707.79 TaxID=1448320 RepID=A0A319D6L0_9EURO|nr:hypothetical protein BO71DRAFT_456467 [Aspergillus ellipticus CBS 707.79]